MSLDANKALIRSVFEKVIPAGDAAGLRDLVAPDWIDHDPLPGQPAGLDGAEYVVTTMHGAHPDLRFTIDDLIAEAEPGHDPVDPARHQHRSHARTAADRPAGRARRHRDLPDRGREDRGAVGRLETRPRPGPLTGRRAGAIVDGWDATPRGG